MYLAMIKTVTYAYSFKLHITFLKKQNNEKCVIYHIILGVSYDGTVSYNITKV